jgi:hypothetical protein
LYGSAEDVEVTPDIKWIFEEGIGIVFYSYGGLKLAVKETFIIKTILNFFIQCVPEPLSISRSSRKVALLESFFAKRVSQTKYASSVGYIWELFIAMMILDVCAEDYRILFNDETNSDLLLEDGFLYKPEHREDSSRLISDSSELSLSLFLRDTPTTFHVSNVFAGPDLVFNLKIGNTFVPVFVQAKLSSTSTFFSQARDTTNPLKFYCGRLAHNKHQIVSTVYAAERKEVIDFLNGKPHLGIVISYPKTWYSIKRGTTDGIRFQSLFDERNLGKYMKLLERLRKL